MSFQLRRGRDRLGIPVKVRESGEEIGEISDVVIAFDGAVSGYVVSPSKGLVRKARAVAARHLEFAGDAAWVEAEDVFGDGYEKPRGIRLFTHEGGLCGRRLRDEDGRLLGSVGDVVFDDEGDRLWGFEVSDGLLKDMLDGRPIVEAAGSAFAGDEIVVGKNGAHMNLDPEGDATP